MFSIILCSLLLLLMLELTSSATVDKGGALVLENLSFLILYVFRRQREFKIINVFKSQLYRHGDRTPSSNYPTDPYGKLKDWPVGFGELTNTGKTQHFKLGQWLRGRYDTDFLPEQYSEQHIYVRSTDVGRTIASALTNLAGIYPPTGDQIWDKSIHWLPIPVHTVPVAVDWLLNSGPPCPAYDQIMAQVIASSDFQKIFTDYRSQIDYVLQNACVSSNLSLPDQLSQIMQMRDTLFIETLYKKA